MLKRHLQFGMFAIITLCLIIAVGCFNDDEETPTTPTLSVSTDATANKALLTDLTGANSVSVAGTWTNNTFGSTGDVATTASFDATTNLGTLIFDIDGGVYGGADPAAETFTVDLSAFITNGTAELNVTSTTYGDVSISLTFYTDNTGGFTGTAINEPSGNVTNAQFSGSFETNGGSVSLVLDDTSFNYNGTQVTCSSSLTMTLN